MKVGGQRHAPAALPPKREPVTVVLEAGLASGPFWAGEEYLARTGTRSRAAQPVARRYTD
jgi:hypothetical protein